MLCPNCNFTPDQDMLQPMAKELFTDKIDELQEEIGTLGYWKTNVKPETLEGQMVYRQLDKEINKLKKIKNSLTRLYEQTNPEHEDKQAITRQVIELVKLKPVQEVAEQAGLQMRKQNGYEYICRCPFHNEKTPSFYATKKNFFHCFGCGWSGDAIKFYMDYFKYSFLEAVTALAKTY